MPPKTFLDDIFTVLDTYINVNSDVIRDEHRDLALVEAAQFEVIFNETLNLCHLEEDSCGRLCLWFNDLLNRPDSNIEAGRGKSVAGRFREQAHGSRDLSTLLNSTSPMHALLRLKLTLTDIFLMRLWLEQVEDVVASWKKESATRAVGPSGYLWAELIKAIKELHRTRRHFERLWRIVEGRDWKAVKDISNKDLADFTFPSTPPLGFLSFSLQELRESSDWLEYQRTLQPPPKPTATPGPSTKPTTKPPPNSPPKK
ncbi:hypothetical protein B0H63DRAFT_476482 [Podospora didyma]|uniref:Uncharacterized protein n=1 Tax=Podospora didyma TaxID=330526 RepID=A0AAE0TW43_9PEZI|nr:hypothetical protein B0H63DRAFT_476482 [Podospora didyma]